MDFQHFQALERGQRQHFIDLGDVDAPRVVGSYACGVDERITVTTYRGFNREPSVSFPVTGVPTRLTICPPYQRPDATSTPSREMRTRSPSRSTLFAPTSTQAS